MGKAFEYFSIKAIFLLSDCIWNWKSISLSNSITENWMNGVKIRGMRGDVGQLQFMKCLNARNFCQFSKIKSVIICNSISADYNICQSAYFLSIKLIICTMHMWSETNFLPQMQKLKDWATNLCNITPYSVTLNATVCQWIQNAIDFQWKIISKHRFPPIG